MSRPSLFEQLEVQKAARVDLLAFAAAFASGLLAYFGLRWAGAEQWMITLALVGVMVLYAVAAMLLPRMRVRLDQAGDNAYYLGLLFTLTSMAVALREFGVAEFSARGGAAVANAGARQIIGNFGVALATTIAGIFLRLILHQMRVDPADIEAMSRIELSEASKRVKSVLDSVSTEMAKSMDELRQRTGDHVAHMVEEVAGSLADLSSQASEAIGAVVKASADAQQSAIGSVTEASATLTTMVTEVGGAVRRLKAIHPPPLEFAERLRLAGEQLDALSSRVEVIGQRMGEAGEGASRTGQSLDALASRLGDLTKASGQQQAEVLEGIRDSAREFREALGSAGKAITANQQLLEQLESQTKRVADAANESQTASARVLQSLASATREIAATINRRA